MLCAVCISAIIASCADISGNKSSSGAQSDAPETIQKEVMGRISRRVLSQIPDAGRLKEVRARGVLRVALPATEKPFQYPDPRFGLPAGFNPSLANEISSVLEVKTNIVMAGEVNKSKNSDWHDKFDVMFLTGETQDCEGGRRIKYFFTGVEGWKTLCVSEQGGPELSAAVVEILIYLNETGIFARLYHDYVE